MSREFSCEHCGKAETRQAPRRCEHGCLMCFDCTEEADIGQPCPTHGLRHMLRDITGAQRYAIVEQWIDEDSHFDDFRRFRLGLGRVVVALGDETAAADILAHVKLHFADMQLALGKVPWTAQIRQQLIECAASKAVSLWDERYADRAVF